MIDICTRQEERDFFVTGLDVNEDFSMYSKFYADGHEEINPFTIHNFNAEIYHMKTSFESKEKQYRELMKIFFKGIYRDAIKNNLFLILFIYFNYNIDINNVLGILLKIIAYGCYAINALSQTLAYSYAREKMKEFEATEYYFKNLEKFKIDFTNPDTNREEEWFIINPTKIPSLKGIRTFEKYSTDESKDMFKKDLILKLSSKKAYGGNHDKFN